MSDARWHDPFTHVTSKPPDPHAIRYQMSCLLAMILIVSAAVWVNDYVIAAESSSNVTQSSLVVPYKGTIPKGPLTFPLYKGKDFQYFSAGVGLEERQATYPPYPLKLILVEGPRAYLSTVALTIRQLDGSLVFKIPFEHVQGPWLFLDIPQGTYLVTATTHQQKTIEKQISIQSNTTQVVYLHWPSD